MSLSHRVTRRIGRGGRIERERNACHAPDLERRDQRAEAEDARRERHGGFVVEHALRVHEHDSDALLSSTYSTQRTAYHTAHSTEHNIIQTYSKNNIIQTYSVLKTTEYAYTSRIMASKQP